jgi:hypothetical protein
VSGLGCRSRRRGVSPSSAFVSREGGWAGAFPDTRHPTPEMQNPLQSEGAAFRFLLYAMAVAAAVIVLVVVIRAVS